MRHPNRFLAGRLTLLLILASLLLMFAASFAYRLGHPSLIKPDRRPGESDVRPAGSVDGPSADSGRHIAELMARLAAEPDSYDLRLELAEHFMDDGDWDRAAAFLRRAGELRPGESRPHLYLGYVLFNQEDFRAAADHYERALAIAPDATAKVNLAYIYKNFLNLEPLADKLFNEVIAAPDTDEELRRIARDLKTEPALRPDGAPGP